MQLVFWKINGPKFMSPSQDYELAKTKKEEIDRKRESVYRENNVSELLELTGKVNANDELRPHTQHDGRRSSR